MVRYGNRVQVQELLSQSSYLSSNDPRLHFGLGSSTSASVEVRWPSGLIEKFSSVKVDQLINPSRGRGPGNGQIGPFFALTGYGRSLYEGHG